MIGDKAGSVEEPQELVMSVKVSADSDTAPGPEWGGKSV